MYSDALLLAVIFRAMRPFTLDMSAFVCQCINEREVK
jgi:hypothetical protein